MAGCNCYEYANQMANYGNEIREYIQQLMSAGASNTTEKCRQCADEGKIDNNQGQDQEAHCHHRRHGREYDQQ
jgi:hypothetical protein